MGYKKVLRANVKRDRARRTYHKQIGDYSETYLAVVNGVIKAGNGRYWVHDIAGADANGNNTYGAERQARIKPGAVIDPRPNWKVNVVTIRGIEYIESMNFDELERIGYDPHQLNPADPSLQFKLIEHLQNLQSFPNGDATVRVMPSIYRKSDGTYNIFAIINLDILTGNVPSTDNQVVVCIWLDETTNTALVTVSSEETVDTDLKLDPATALTLINECAAAAPAGALGITAYIIWDDTAAITTNNKFHDLRGIVGSGMGASGAISAATLVLEDGSELTLSANTNGVITVTKARHTVDTFADASTGDLKTVNGLSAGEVCVITAAHTDRTIVVKHTGGTDISCTNGLDITLDDTIKGVLLLGNLAGTGVNAYPLFDEVTSSSINTFTNKTVSASANTLIQGSGVTKTLASDVCAAGTDRNLVISAESSTTDNLIEVSGLVIGETVWLRATAGHTITVVHNSGSATVKIHLNGDTNTTLDEQNPLELKLVATNVLSQEKHSSSGSSILNNYAATTAPTVNDDSGDGYSVGSRWFDVTADKIYECIDASVGAAIWIEVVVRTQTQSLSNKTFTDQVLIDGTADEIPLRVQHHAGAFSDLASFENSAGAVQAHINYAGGIVVNEQSNGLTHSLRVGSSSSANAFVVGGVDGEIGIGIDPVPMSSSDLKVDIVSTEGMLGIPAMTTAQMSALNPRDGAAGYDTDLDKFFGEAGGTKQPFAFDTRYGAMITHNANQTFNASVVTTLSFNTTIYDSGHGFSNTAGADPTFTIPAGLGGLYMVGFNGKWSDNASALNNCNIDIVINSGANVVARAEQQKGAFTTGINSLTQYISVPIPLDAGDTVEIHARHQSVNGTGITANADYSPRFWIFRISD